MPMIWPALRAVVDGVIWTLEAAGTAYDAGARLVNKLRGKKPPEPPHPKWLDVNRQRQQAAAAAHAFPPPAPSKALQLCPHTPKCGRCNACSAVHCFLQPCPTNRSST